MTIKNSGLWCDLCNNPLFNNDLYWNILINDKKGYHACKKCKDKNEGKDECYIKSIPINYGVSIVYAVDECKNKLKTYSFEINKSMDKKKLGKIINLIADNTDEYKITKSWVVDEIKELLKKEYLYGS